MSSSIICKNSFDVSANLQKYSLKFCSEFLNYFVQQLSEKIHKIPLQIFGLQHAELIKVEFHNRCTIWRHLYVLRKRCTHRSYVFIHERQFHNVCNSYCAELFCFKIISFYFRVELGRITCCNY